MIPYMRANLSLKRRSLADADAVIAVSSADRARSADRGARAGATRIEMIPNPVDVAGIRAQAARARAATARPIRALRRQARAEQGRRRSCWRPSSARVSTGRSSSSATAPSGRDSKRPRDGRDATSGSRAGCPARTYWRGCGTRRCWCFRRTAPSRSAACCSKRARSACRSPRWTPAARRHRRPRGDRPAVTLGERPRR